MLLYRSLSGGPTLGIRSGHSVRVGPRVTEAVPDTQQRTRAFQLNDL